MKKYSILIAVVLQGLFAVGQENMKSTVNSTFNINNIIPTSPEAASLAKFKETEVSKFTGIPNVSIPLYSVSLGELGFPISLNYHSGGIRVNEIASQVGLGWTIFSGGEISRTKKGSWTDDNSDGFIFTPYKVADLGANNIPYVATHFIDTEPDEFNLSLPNGKSVKFYFSQDESDNTQNIVAFPFSDVKITAVYSGYKIVSWIVKDTDGAVYEFGTNNTIEQITNVVAYSLDDTSLPAPIAAAGLSDNYYTTSWKLTSVTNNNNQILFDYRREDYNLSENCIYQGESTTFEFITNQYGNTIQKTMAGTRGHNLLLKKIRSRKEIIKFNESTTVREDLKYSKNLHNIEVYDSLSHNLKKRFDFDYSYFVSNPDHVYNGYGCGAPFDTLEIGKRLCLRKLREMNVSSPDTITHKFEYYEDVILPHRNSYAQDYWGYYNGEVNNSSLMPSYVMTKDDAQFIHPSSISTTFALKISGAKRNINPGYTHACMLKNITYPEGGLTEFIYENNRTAKNKEMKENLIDYYTQQQLTLDTQIDSITVASYDSQYYKISKPFTLAATYADILGIDYTTFSDNCVADPAYPNIDCAKFNIINTDTGDKVFPTPPIQYGKVLGYNGNISNIGNLPNYIVPGNYVLEIYVKKSEWDAATVKPHLSVNLKWGTYADAAYSYFGGMRISEIRNYESAAIAQPKTIKSYSYLDQNGKESGDYINLPVFKKRETGRFVSYLFLGEGFCYMLALIDAGIIKMSSSSVVPLVSVAGNNIAYTQVKERLVDYNNPVNTQSRVDNYSFTHPVQSFEEAPVGEDWTRGLLTHSVTPLTTDNYAYDGGENNYGLRAYDFSTPPTFVKWLTQCDGRQEWHLDETSSMEYQYYTLNTNTKMNMVSKASTIDNLTTITEYAYSGASLLASEKTTSSSGEDLETKYYYPTDVEMNSEPYISELRMANRIAKPLKTETYRANEKLSEQKTEYINDSSNGLLLPKYVYSNKGTAAISNTTDRRVAFDLYDDKGNLLQYTPEKGMATSIIWGYNNTKPVAKIENKAYAAIDTSLISAVQLASDSGTEAGLLSALADLRSNLPEAMVTTYTYLPLIGVSTITDPKGNRQTYNYDGFGRLESVFDNDGNKLSENQYHYRTQN